MISFHRSPPPSLLSLCLDEIDILFFLVVQTTLSGGRRFDVLLCAVAGDCLGALLEAFEADTAVVAVDAVLEALATASLLLDDAEV